MIPEIHFLKGKKSETEEESSCIRKGTEEEEEVEISG